VLWQELVRWRYYVRLLFAVFTPEQTWVHYFTGARNPISVRKGRREGGRPRWVVVRATKHRLTRGVGWIPQPGRYTNVVEMLNTRSHAHVAMVDSHFTNGKKNRRFSLRSRKARAKLWGDQYEGTCEIVGDLYDRGVSCIGGGDFNDPNFPLFHPEMRVLLKDGVMMAWCLEAPGGATFEINELRVISEDDLETDHAAMLVDASVRPPAGL
jgi:hypothetical protein